MSSFLRLGGELGWAITDGSFDSKRILQVRVSIEGPLFLKLLDGSFTRFCKALELHRALQGSDEKAYTVL